MTSASHSYATSESDRRTLTIVFACAENATARCATIDCVVDVNNDGAVVGVEILDLLATIPALRNHIRPLPIAETAGVRVSIDQRSDGIYLRLREERSRDQRVVRGILTIDSDSCVRIEVPLDQ